MRRGVSSSSRGANAVSSLRERRQPLSLTCVEACPVDACVSEDQAPEEWAKYTQINADYYTSK
jgi:hypothetical protein